MLKLKSNHQKMAELLPVAKDPQVQHLRMYIAVQKFMLVPLLFKKGAKPATKLVSSNLFKGRNQGIDLSFNVLPWILLVQSYQTDKVQSAKMQQVILLLMQEN